MNVEKINIVYLYTANADGKYQKNRRPCGTITTISLVPPGGGGGGVKTLRRSQSSLLTIIQSDLIMQARISTYYYLCFEIAQFSFLNIPYYKH